MGEEDGLFPVTGHGLEDPKEKQSLVCGGYWYWYSYDGYQHDALLGSGEKVGSAVCRILTEYDPVIYIQAGLGML